MNTVSTFHLGISEAVHFTFLSPESIESTGRTTECPSARGADFFVLTGLVAQNKNPHHYCCETRQHESHAFLLLFCKSLKVLCTPNYATRF